MAKRFPWKKRFFKIPKGLKPKLDRLDKKDLIVVAVKKVPRADIERGIYRHLGIKMSASGVEFPADKLPDPSVGPWSRANVEGKEIVRKDLPKYTKTFAVESPNFGDAATYGTHTSYLDRKVYPRDLIPPKHLRIQIEKIDEEATSSGQVYVLNFLIDEVLRPTDSNFEKDLFYNLNLLQENIGVSDVFESDASLEDYLATVIVDWEILRVGEREENLRKILSGVSSTKLQGTVRERYEVLERMKPLTIIRGIGGFQRYFGAQFADDLVVFENIEYGNAIYVMFEDWRELSKKSRIELLKGHRGRIERIVHTPGWKEQLEFVIEQHRK